MTEEASKLNIIFSDNHLIAVVKPARIPVGSEDSGDVTLLAMVREWNAARQQDGKKGYCVPIHFLDRPVSGVIVFALSSKAAARLNEQFRSHSLQKTYVAITKPIPKQAEAKLEHWLAKDREGNHSHVVPAGSPDGKRCELSYKMLATSDGAALLEVKPITGRSHQIRAQLAAISCPIIGDVKYGATAPWQHRVALHALRLQIKHPVGGADLVLEAPLPSYWDEIWTGGFSGLMSLKG